MSGAVLVKDLMEIIKQAGFIEAEFAGTTGIKTSRFTEGAHFRARKPS